MIHEMLQKLITLQKIDHELDEIDSAVKNEQEALDAKVAAVAAREEKIAAIEERIREEKRENQILEGELADKIEYIRGRQAKMMQVQTGKEQTALLKELEDAKATTKEWEEKILSLQESIETLSEEISTEKNLLKGEKTIVSEETETVRKKVESLTRKRKTKEKAREAQAAEIDQKYLEKYSRLRARRNGLAVVAAENGVCQGCFMMMPPQRFNLLMKGDQLDCPTCQRMNYYSVNVEE